MTHDPGSTGDASGTSTSTTGTVHGRVWLRLSLLTVALVWIGSVIGLAVPAI
jgi:hypothetical protein